MNTQGQTDNLLHKKLIKRWDSERELFYDDIVHALQDAITIDLCTYSVTDRRGYVLEHRFTKFSEVTQCNGHYAVHGHSRSPIFGTNRKLIYDFLLVINTNLPTSLHHFQVMADYWSNVCFIALTGGWSAANKWYTAKTRFFGLYSRCRNSESIGVSSTTFT